MQAQETLLDDDLDDCVEELDEIAILHDFGLSKDEAQAYVGLIRLGTAKASEISTFTNIDRVRTYKILETLKNLGFVTSSLSSPIKFSANDPETTLQEIILKQKQKVENLEKNNSRFLKILSHLKISPVQVGLPKLTVISNRNNIYDQIGKLIEDTQDKLYVVVNPSDLIRMYYTPIPKIIKKAIKKNIMIKLMTDSELLTKPEYVHRLGIKYFKIVNLPSPGRLLCNASQVLMSGNTATTLNNTLNEESALITNSFDIVKNMQSLCSYMWKTGKEIHLKNSKQHKTKNKLSKQQSTILVVDDDPDAVDIFADYLEIRGISTVKRCTDGKLALDMFKKLKPDIVFLDIMMPDYDGFYLFKQIRKIDPHVKIVMVTGDSSLETKEKLLSIKPTDVIYKPYDIDQIMTYFTS